MDEPPTTAHPNHVKGIPHTLSSLFALNHDVLAEIMDYLSQSDQAHLARTCRALHTATLPHRCSSLITLVSADRTISSFQAFLRLDSSPGAPSSDSRAPLINKLSIALPTPMPVIDWQTAKTHPIPGYRATFPRITDAVLAILAACTNLSTLHLNSWSARMPADRLCATIAALHALEELHLAVTHDRLWAETPALARLPQLRRLALSLSVDRGFAREPVVLDPAPLPLVATISPHTLTELRLAYDRPASMHLDAGLPGVRRLHLTLTGQRTPQHVLRTLARAFPGMTHLAFGVREWFGLDERAAAQWREENRAWATGTAEGRAAWPDLVVLAGRDVRDLWVLGLARRAPHVCVAERDLFLGWEWSGEQFPGGADAEAFAAEWVRRMLPAVLEDMRPTHLELAGTWQHVMLSGQNYLDVNTAETLHALEECAGGPGASVSHLVVNIPAPEVLHKQVLGAFCAVLANLAITHLYVRVLIQPAEEARGPHYSARLVSWVLKRLESYAWAVAEACSTLSCIAFYLEGVTLRAWSVSRPELYEMSKAKAWATVAEEKLFAYQTDFSRSEKDIPDLADP